MQEEGDNEVNKLPRVWQQLIGWSIAIFGLPAAAFVCFVLLAELSVAMDNGPPHACVWTSHGNTVCGEVARE
jgi:hypothetical protein